LTFENVDHKAVTVSVQLGEGSVLMASFTGVRE